MAACVFAADLHLRPEAPEGARALERLTASLAPGDELWLLGDLFEFWAGRGHAALPDHRPALESLRETGRRGISIRFLPGNRDFLLEDRTLREWGMEPAGGTETMIERQGRRIYLAHGEFLCPKDLAYRRAAALLRNPASLWIGRRLPFPLAYRAAQSFRRHSEAKRGRPTEPGTYDLSEGMLAGIADRMNVDDLIVGHVHKPVDRPVAGCRKPAVLHVLDPWHGEGAPFLRLEGGHFSRGSV